MINWSDFQKQSSLDWMAKANQDSKGKYVAEELKYDVEGDYIISPFLTEFSGSVYSIVNIYPKTAVYIKVSNANQANKMAVQFLELGFDNIFFEIENTDMPLSVLLDGIYLNMADVSIFSSGDINILNESIQKYLGKSSENQNNKISIYHKPHIYMDSTLTFKQRVLNFIEKVKKYGGTQEFIVEVGLKDDFLAQVSELRALRQIWNNEHLDPKKLIIISSLTESQKQDIHPLIATNYKLMSAVIGMSNFTKIDAGDDYENARLLFNMTKIFSYESKLDVVSDPVAGSYLIETLTHMMANTGK